MLPKSLLFLLMLFLSASTGAFGSVEDSLLNELKNARHDTDRVRIFHELGYELSYSDPTKALEYYQKGIEILHKLAEVRSLKVYVIHREALLWRNISAVYESQGDYSRAQELAEKALNLFIRIGNGAEVCYSNVGLGNISFGKGDYDKAMHHYQIALKYADSIGITQTVAFCQNNIGLIFDYQDEKLKALEYYSKSLKTKELLSKEKPWDQSYIKGRSNSLHNMGNIYIDLDSFPKALECFFASLKLRRDLGDSMLVGFSIANIGLVYKNMNNYYAADTCFMVGKRMIESVQSESGLAMINIAMATNYNEWGKYQKAIESAEEGLVIAQRIGAKKSQMDAYIEMSKGNAALKNFGKAYEYLVLGNALKDSIWKEEKQKQISELETKYESAKKEKEIVLLTKEKELQKTDLERQDALIAKRETQRNALIAGILLLVILAFVIYRGYSRKKHDNILLASQKEEITTQKEEIETQRDEIFVQKHIIEEKNKSLTDSIRYAHRIQSALLPSRKALNDCCNDFFILYKPRDIVSGDFYWAANRGNVHTIAVADCTGHGVPGALMSMLGITFLNEISRRNVVYTAAEILEELRKDVIRSLQQKNQQYKVEDSDPEDYREVNVMDGMDIAICIVDLDKGKMQFAGANNGCLLVLPNGETVELKPDKMPVGIYHGDQKPFINQSVEAGKEFRIYLYTDGYADQFGGIQGKKYLYSKLRALIAGSSVLPLADQLKLMETELESWLDPKSTGARQYEQTDDITILGMQFNG